MEFLDPSMFLEHISEEDNRIREHYVTMYIFVNGSEGYNLPRNVGSRDDAI